MAQKANRVRNWRKYNEALVARGSISFWFSQDAIENWHHDDRSSDRGRPRKYSDMAITCGLTLKAIFNLTFRTTEGFVRSLIGQLDLNVEAPDYSSLCRRQKSLIVKLPQRRLKKGEKIRILVDSTGLKVFGEGEWKVRQHGYIKHRLWRKLHLAINSDSQEIEAFELTELGTQDCEGFTQVVKKIKKPIESAIGDGAYDRFSCYEIGEQKKFKLIAPPQRNAKLSRERTRNRKKKVSLGAIKKRDGVIEKARKLGRKKWKIKIGYHQRSLAETAMFRMKTLLGNRLKTRTLQHQRTEVAIWCQAINKITSLGFGMN